MKQIIKSQSGITLIALIVTIIILVIFAAVSIRTVVEMEIVTHAINGTKDYAKEAKKEENIMSEAERIINDALTKTKHKKIITFKINNIDYSAEDGMTFIDWVNSDYGKDFGFYCDWYYGQGSSISKIYICKTDAINPDRISSSTITRDGVGGIHRAYGEYANCCLKTLNQSSNYSADQIVANENYTLRTAYLYAAPELL